MFPGEPERNDEASQRRCRGCPTSSSRRISAARPSEAQARIGEEVARKLIDYSDAGATSGAVNFPQVQLPRTAGTRYIHVHRNVPGMLGG